ncbi:MAG: two-component system sensor histidine kinase CreC [Pontiellaceae bacterium]|nr:two-component system sensor histidine kinase CreC [Pontiellaceae bacterium]
MKIRSRLFLTATLLVAGGLYWLVDWIVQDVRLHYFMTMEESMVDTSVLLAAQVAQFSDDDGIRVDDDFRAAMQAAAERELSAKIYDFTKKRMNLRVLVTDPESTVLYDSRNGEAEGELFSKWRDVRLTLAGEYGARASYETPGDMDSFHFYVAAPVMRNGELIGVVSVGKPVLSITPFMQQARGRLVMSGVIAFVAILLLLIPVSLWVIHPVRELTVYARKVRDGKKTAPPAVRKGEMGELTQAFEEMRDALEGKSYVEEYVQSLTHEMKSPLAAIRGAAELLDEEMTPEQRRRFLENIRVESDRLHGLVERMLSLAALEKRKELMRTDVIDVHDLLIDVVDSLMPVASARQIAISKSVPEGTQLHGEYFLLRQAVANLLRNAIDFSPTGSTIELTARCESDMLYIEVLDCGEGIPDYALARIFERFYSLPRPDGGRKGSGLGLNFVREIARLHNGDIQLTNRPDGGTCASLFLPMEV